MWLTLLWGVLGQIPGMIGDWAKTQQEIKKIELDNKKQVEVEKWKYAGEIAKSQVDMAKTVLNATGAKFKYFTFFMWFGPYMASLINADLGKRIFDNMDVMPQWYAESCVLIMFTIWGIQVGAPVVNGIFERLGSYFESRRAYKLERHKINREAYWAAQRIQLKRPLTQAEVDAGERIFDELDKGGYTPPVGE